MAGKYLEINFRLLFDQEEQKMIRVSIQRGLRTSVSSVAIMLGTLVAPAVVQAQVAEVPYSISNDATAWTVDRSDVASFGNTSWQGRDNVLHLNITPPANPSSFYNWQGYSQQTSVPAGDSFLRGDIWIDQSWTNGDDTDYIRTGMWGSALPEATVAGGSYVDSEAVFPIISFTNQDGNGRLEVWDTTANPDGGWVNLTETGNVLQYGGWNTFDMRLLPDSDRIEYYVNGSLIYTWQAPRNSEDGLSDQYFAAYLQGRNNGVTSFDTYWSQLRSGLVIADGGEIGDTPGDILLTGATGTAFVATGATINGTVVADSGSGVTLAFSEDASVATNNAGAHGVSSTEGGTVSLEGGTVATSGAGAHGLYVEGDGSAVHTSGTTVVTTGKGADAVVANGEGSSISLAGGTISTDYRRGPGGANAGINTHALLAVNGGLITGSDLVISGSNDGYFDGVVSVKAGSEISLSNSTISNEMSYSDFSAAGATADGDNAVLRLDGTSVSVVSDKRTIGSSAGAIGVTNGGTVYINQGADAVLAGERDQIAASGNWVRGIVAANGAGNLVDASNVAITTDGANAYGVQVGAGGTDTGSSVVLHFSGIHTVGANAHGIYVASSDGGPALFTGEDVEVETSGQGAYAVVADGAGSAVTLAGGTVTTSGDRTYGLVARGAGSSITSSADVTTAGEWAFGAYADDGAQITLTGGTVTTNGFRAHGLLAEDGAVIDSAANVATLGDRAHGVQAGSYGHGDSTITLTGGSVSTAGSGAYGLLASFGGSITGVADIHTVGDGSFGASADGDGYINLTGGQITTEGDGSHGLLVVYDDRAQGAGVLDADVNVTTSGANAFGVLALDGGTANLTGGTIATTGVDSFGIAAAGAFPGTTSSPSSVTADQLTITTSGAGAHGFVLADAAIGSLGNSSVVTHGEAAHAVSVADGATITVANATLQATGTDSSGVAMQNSADVTIADTEIISSGATFASSLTQAGQVQNITLASGVVAVENNGTLLLINRTDDGGDGVVNFHLEAGSTTKGDILDLDTKTEGYSSVTIASGADFAGRVKGVRDYQSAPGSSTSFDEKAEIEGDVTASGSSYAFSDEGAEIGGNVSLENGSSTTGGTIENRIHVAGNVNSDDTSRMGGNWQIDGDLNSSGTTTPGNSIGIDSVSGDLNLGATHVYEAEVNQLGQSDLIEVGGIAYLDGSVETSALGGYLVHTPYTILTADGGFAGTEFQNVTWAGGNVFVAPVLSYDPNTVYLSFERSSASFAQLGSTANQQAAARGLDGYGFGNNLVKTLAFAPTAQAPAALDQLSGEVHASAKAALVEESHFLRDAVGSHLRAAFNGDDAAGAAAGSWWGYGFGSWSRFDSTAETARVKSSVGGFLMGIDGALAQNWRLGLVGGYSRTSLHIDDRASSATSNNYHLGIYTGADVDGVNLSASVAHTWHKLKTRRSVAFDTFSDPSLADDYNARTLQAFGEVSYNLGKDDLVLMPYANLAYVRLHANDRLEKGGEAALGAASQNMETLFTTLGMKLSSSFDLGGVQAKPSGRFGWRHAFNDISSDARQHFVDASDFTVQGAPIAKDAATIEAGVDFAVSTRATLGISYQGQFGSGVQENGLKAMLDVRF